MRTMCFVLIACAVAPAGCSMLIADSGQNVSHLATRAEVQAELGPPAVSTASGTEAADEYATRRKISEWSRGVSRVGTAWVLTGGLMELVLFPHELYVNCRRVAVGQQLRFTYDADGKVTSIWLNGKEQPSVHHVPRP